MRNREILGSTLEIISSLKRTLCAAVLIRAEKKPAKRGSITTVIAALTLMVVVLVDRPDLATLLGGSS